MSTDSRASKADLPLKARKRKSKSSQCTTKTSQKTFNGVFRKLRKYLFPNMKANGLRAKTMLSFLQQDLPRASIDIISLWHVFLATCKNFPTEARALPDSAFPPALLPEWYAYLAH